MALSVFEFVALLALPGFVFWIWCLIDALKRPDNEWAQAGQNKLVWILVLIFVSLAGSIVYLAVARPQLEKVKEVG